MSEYTINPRMNVRRSKFYMPVSREKFVDKAWAREADCIILDLEDAIAPADKASARKKVKEVIQLVKAGCGKSEHPVLRWMNPILQLNNC
jgi:citrate lyase beta subunit